MLNAAQRYLVQAPWMAIYPGLMIFGVVMSLNVVATRCAMPSTRSINSGGSPIVGR
jgi:ABC-type dipeptide/oligopeptide/nickel transport system permease subunit